ncbi:septum formation family protein [Microbacterium sp. NC79]|uniref:septum formation family protein n=1 Tax=Microbacterium sp. NC79 TaxID=2851009 RepID=UPI001C2C4720|nr:septum formation family protein [Microbacterium sp. NC79]MBV0895046.1 septum formation family protein [Microbacterium sp. NC79]
MSHSTIARRSLAAGAALALALSLGGCAAVQNLFGSDGDVQRDESGEVTEAGTGSAFELEVGDCLDFPSAEEFNDVKLIPCGTPHDAEVFLNYETAESTFDEDALYAEAEEQCAAEFQSYVGSDPATSKFYYTYFTPVEAGWEGGDRVVTCVAVQLDEARESMVLTSGSVRGLAE